MYLLCPSLGILMILFLINIKQLVSIENTCTAFSDTRVTTQELSHKQTAYLVNKFHLNYLKIIHK